MSTSKRQVKESRPRFAVAEKTPRAKAHVRVKAHARVKRPSRWKIPAITPVGAPAPVSETLPRAVERIAANLNPEKIILFGSYAYGTPTPDSDVDLLVVLDSPRSEKERYLAVCRQLRPRPFAADILVRTSTEIETALRQGDYFIGDIVNEGKVLHERQR